jgi:hypothetical protein
MGDAGTPDVNASFLTVNEELERTGLVRDRLRPAEGRKIGLQTAQEGGYFHSGGDLTDPYMHAGFELIQMPLNAKARVLHKISGEEAGYGLHDPGMRLDIAVTESQLDGRDISEVVHVSMPPAA